MDEPIADAAFITTYLVSKFARQDVTVILSGVGGDELFGGYKRYLDEHYRGFYQRIPAAIRSAHLAAGAGCCRATVTAGAEPDAVAKAFLRRTRCPSRIAIAPRCRCSTPRNRKRRSHRGRAFDDCIARGFSDAQADDPLRQLMDVDFATQLPDDLLMLTDKMSMAVSLEGRVPLLDHPVVEFAARHAGAP